MKKIIPFIFLFLIAVSLKAQDTKVVGYLPYYRFNYVSEIEFEKLTHLCIAFANPDMDGNLDVGGQDIEPVVEIAHDAGLTVLLSLAGGALTPDWAAAWEELIKPANRSEFIHKIMNYLEAYELQGADVDLEWSHVDYNYSGFVLELRDSIDAHGMLMTAALPGTYRYPQITDEAMHAFDFINMMAYDLTGSWAPDDPGPHSPYWFAVSSINYWKNQGMQAEKLTLGLPFYGYDFTNPLGTVSFTYRSMVTENEDYAWVDQVGLKYYNGIPTIMAKTELAMEATAGICIWELGQDSYDDFSLLNVIHAVANGLTPVQSQISNSEWLVFPNPFSQSLHVEELPEAPVTLRLTSLEGRIVYEEDLEGVRSHFFETADIPAGIYFMTLLEEGRIETVKVIKQ